MEETQGTQEDQEFLRRFEASAIPNEEWTHEAHLRMAFLQLRDAPFDRALERIRHGIHRLNRANGVENTATSGYHETLTVAWARLVAARIRSGDASRDFAAFMAVYRRVLRQAVIFDYYSRARLFGDPRARLEFVAPDRRGLPGDRETPPARPARTEPEPRQAWWRSTSPARTPVCSPSRTFTWPFTSVAR